MPLILTLTLNPCIDRTVSSTDPQEITEQTGGKGINVARVLRALGVDCAAIVPLGAGPNAQKFRAMAAKEGVPLLVSPIEADVRRIDTFRNPVDNSQHVVYRKGLDASDAEVHALRSLLRSELPRARLLIISGSAPGPNLAAFAGEAVALAKQAGVETLLDSNGEALLKGFAAGPELIKPNQDECAQLLGRVISVGDEVQAAEELLAHSAANGLRGVIVSLGERGAVWAREGSTLLCPAPKVNVINPVGSGDCFVAGLCWALLNGYSEPGALAMACAAGAANAARFPAARIALCDIMDIISGQV